MRYDKSSAKTLVKQATMVVVDREIYDVKQCHEDYFEALTEDGEYVQVYYDEIDLELDSIYKTILLNP
jgi:hypothetical protein